jgi:hypothetical protein
MTIALVVATGARADTPQDADAASTDPDSTEAVSIGPDERDERIVWAGEIDGTPVRLAISPKDPTVPGCFVTWQGPIEGSVGLVAGSAVATQGDLRSAANFKFGPGVEPYAQLALTTTGRWSIEVIPPVADAARKFPKPIAFVISVGESTVEGRPSRRPIRDFYRRPEIRYTFMGVCFFVIAIIAIVRRYRG